MMLSFTILDDLQYTDDPVHVEIDNTETDTLKAAIDKIAAPYLKYIQRRKGLDYKQTYSLEDVPDEKADSSGYFFELDFDIHEIIDDLQEQGYYCLNRYQKYYVVAFALNYTRFEVFSKDCDKEIINWGNDKEGEIVHRIQNEKYNENPVVSFMKSLH